MRDNKPKIWDKVLNKMADDIESIDFSSQTVKIAYKQEINGIEVHPFTWYRKFAEVEFLYPTGLKDKNDKEIYEGDIVLEIRGKAKMKICFFRGNFSCSKLNSTSPWGSVCEIHNYCEVIGNIYEHELLNKE